MDERFTVGQVADEFGVTVRTLHHYDEIGLLRPSERSHAGYRLYTHTDLEHLASIVTYRRLGLSLDEVAELLSGHGSAVEVLTRQRDAVMTRVGELTDLVGDIDRALEREMNQQPATRPATHEELREIFGDGFSDEYQVEAEQRWGDTQAWTQSHERTKGYTKADWEQIKAETDQINAAFVAAMTAGRPATSTEAMDAAEAARRQIDTRFYDCTPQFHRCLGDMYVEDPRFTATYEELAPGLAQYVRDAIHANADRSE